MTFYYPFIKKNHTQNEHNDTCYRIFWSSCIFPGLRWGLRSLNKWWDHISFNIPCLRSGDEMRGGDKYANMNISDKYCICYQVTVKACGPLV